jgi:hypothetical protein
LQRACPRRGDRIPRVPSVALFNFETVYRSVTPSLVPNRYTAGRVRAAIAAVAVDRQSDRSGVSRRTVNEPSARVRVPARHGRRFR